MSDEIRPDVLEKTQKTLGKYVNKPPLSEKLLKKPPFRFLHDIIVAVIRSTGFLNGLYTEAELVSENVKDRDAKIAFLSKLIDAVKAITKIDLAVKPSKVIAGLEPKETNKLLQAIATALDKKLSSEGYVKDLKSGLKSKPTPRSNNEKGKVKKTSKSTRNEDKESSRSKPIENTRPKVEKPKKKESIKQSKQVKGAASQNKIEHENVKKNKEEDDGNVRIGNADQSILPHETTEIAAPVSNSNTDENIDIKTEIAPEIPEVAAAAATRSETESENKEVSQPQDVKPEEGTSINKFSRSERPKSARPQTAAAKKDNNNEKDEVKLVVSPKNEMPVRPRSSLRPPSVRPSSARPGAPRLRVDPALPQQESVQMGKINVIVENYSAKEADEEETVVIRTTESHPEVQSVAEILDIPADKGHLVEQILEQIHEDDVAEHSRPKPDVEWEHDGFRNRDATNKEIAQLRSSIQALTRVANPLGKFMNYLHEDVEAMHSELNMWMNMKKQIWNEINKQKRINKDANKPLKAQLKELEENIKKQEEEIQSARFNILRNDMRIKEMFK